jgi:hypothetical protein
MNLYHATTKGLRECREARRQRLQRPHVEALAEHKRRQRKTSLIARLLHWHS